MARRPGLCCEKQNWSNDITSCYQKVGRLCVAVCDTLEVHELQGRHKLPNQGPSNIISQRFHPIRFQGVINEDYRVRLFFATNRFLTYFSS